MNLFIPVLFAFLISFETYAGDNSNPAVNLNSSQIAYEFAPTTSADSFQKATFNNSVKTEEKAVDEEMSAVQRENVLSGMIIYSLILLVYSVYWYKNSRPTE